MPLMRAGIQAVARTRRRTPSREHSAPPDVRASPTLPDSSSRRNQMLIRSTSDTSGGSRGGRWLPTFQPKHARTSPLLWLTCKVRCRIFEERHFLFGFKHLLVPGTSFWRIQRLDLRRPYRGAAFIVVPEQQRPRVDTICFGHFGDRPGIIEHLRD